MAATATIAASLAHELTQPLAAACNYLRLSVRQLQSAEGMADDVAPIVESAEKQISKAIEIVRRARSFVAEGRISGRCERLPLLVEQAFTTLPEDVRTGVDLFTFYAPDTDCVLVDRVMIGQVLTNLLANAIETLEGRRHRRIEIRTRRQVDEVVVRIKDSGPGLPDDVRSQMFKPLFTTKARGTGLGLPICQSIVEAHGGRIWAESPAGGGTEICFSLQPAK